jgi:DNA-binding phage protein
MIELVYDYDPAAILDNEESIVVFFADALETGAQLILQKLLVL